MMLFIFALPVMQVILFCLAIGRDPTGLKLAVVNNEMIGGVSFTLFHFPFVSVTDLEFLFFQECFYEQGCKFANLSCRYLDHLGENIDKVYYPDPDAAKAAVERGDAWGVLYFTENFTDALIARITLGK